MTQLEKNLIAYVIDHLKFFRCYPMEFEYKNKVYDYNFIIKTIKNRKKL